MTIDFQDIEDGYTPSTQVETDWVGGLSALPSTTKSCLFYGHKTSSGSAVLNTIYRVYGRADAIVKFGAGSDLAVMAEIFFSITQSSPLYCVAFTDAGGTAAANTVTLASNATSAGKLKVWIAGKLFQVVIASGDTPTAIGDLIVAKINAEVNFPVTAANATGTVTLTSRTKGAHQNTVRYRSEITCTGMTSTDGGAVLASGATTDSPATALANALSQRYHIHGWAFNDATTCALLKAHVEAESSVSAKHWCFGVSGHNGTAAEAQTLADNAAFDSYRMQIMHVPAADQPIYMLAAEFAAWRCKTLDKYSLNKTVLKNITVPYDQASWPINTEIEANLDGGVTATRVVNQSYVEIVRSVTSRQSTPISFRDHMIAGISDYTDEYVIGQFESKVEGKPLKSASPPGSSRTVTPERGVALLNVCLKKLDSQDWIQGVEDSIAAGHNKAEVNASNPDRLDLAHDFFPIRFAHRIAIKKTFITERRT